MGRVYSPALPIAHAALRVLVVLNLVFGAAILALLTYTFIDERWSMKALGVDSYPNAQTVINAMRVVAALGVGAIFLNHGILKRLLAVVGTVRAGDPFVAENASRLQAIAWLLLWLQLLSLAIATIARIVSTPEHPVDLDAGFSISGWLGVILTFVLARVFAEGTRMREDLEGTV